MRRYVRKPTTNPESVKIMDDIFSLDECAALLFFVHRLPVRQVDSFAALFEILLRAGVVAVPKKPKAKIKKLTGHETHKAIKLLVKRFSWEKPIEKRAQEIIDRLNAAPVFYKKKSTSADFYKSDEWRRVRYEALRAGGGKCQLCGVTAGESQLHVDHIIPRSIAPELSIDPGNTQVLCIDCNLGKMNHDDTDWRS